jgi:hypothetical protein
VFVLCFICRMVAKDERDLIRIIPPIDPDRRKKRKGGSAQSERERERDFDSLQQTRVRSPFLPVPEANICFNLRVASRSSSAGPFVRLPMCNIERNGQCIDAQCLCVVCVYYCRTRRPVPTHCRRFSSNFLILLSNVSLFSSLYVSHNDRRILERRRSSTSKESHQSVSSRSKSNKLIEPFPRQSDESVPIRGQMMNRLEQFN